jgi:hypothetical protein
MTDHDRPNLSEGFRLVLLVNFLERLYLLLSLLLGNAVGFLNCACQLVALAGDGVAIVRGKLVPPLFDMPFELRSIAFDYFPIHGGFLRW